MFNVIFFSFWVGMRKGYSNNLLHCRDAGRIFILQQPWLVCSVPNSMFPNLNLRFQSGCVHMLKLSKFGRGNYKCFKNGNYKSWKRTAGTPYHWMRSFKSRDRPDMQHKLPSSICPILLNFLLSLCSVIIWGKLQLALSPTHSMLIFQ